MIPIRNTAADSMPVFDSFSLTGSKFCFGIELYIYDNGFHLCILKARENFSPESLGLILNEDLKSCFHLLSA